MRIIARGLQLAFDEQRVEAARGRIRIVPDTGGALRLAEHERAEFVYHTAALEGNALSLSEIDALLANGPLPGRKEEDIAQAKRLDRALTYVLDKVRNNSFEFCVQTACAIHNRVAEDEALQWGKFRESDVFIRGTGYQVPSAAELPRLFERGRSVLEYADDPLLRACLAFLWGARAQYFYDGNKRTARLLSNGILLSAGYPPVMVTIEEKPVYDQVMTRLYDSQDATEALEWLFGIYEKCERKFWDLP